MNINDMIQECLEQLKSSKSENTVRSYKDGMEVFVEYLKGQEPTPQNFIDFPSYAIRKYGNKRTAQNRVAAVSYLRYWMTSRDYLKDWTESHTSKYTFIKRDSFSKRKFYKPKVVPKSVVEASFEAVKTMKVLYPIERTRNEALVLLMESSGIRVSEVAALNVNDVYLNEEKLYVDKGKGDKSGYYPISPAAGEGIHKYWEERNWTEDNPPAFGRHDKQSSKNHLRLKAGGIERIIARLSDQMGMPGVLTPHKYRHHRGTEVTRKYGVHAAQKWLHHENIDTTEGYVDLGDEYIMDIAKEMFTK